MSRARRRCQFVRPCACAPLVPFCVNSYGSAPFIYSWTWNLRRSWGFRSAPPLQVAEIRLPTYFSWTDNRANTAGGCEETAPTTLLTLAVCVLFLRDWTRVTLTHVYLNFDNTNLDFMCFCIQSHILLHLEIYHIPNLWAKFYPKPMSPKF